MSSQLGEIHQLLLTTVSLIGPKGAFEEVKLNLFRLFLITSEAEGSFTLEAKDFEILAKETFTTTFASLVRISLR